MLAPNQVIKKTAKAAFLPRFLHSAAVCCVIIFTWFIGLFSSSLISVFAGTIGYLLSRLALLFFVLCPLLLGAIYYFRRLIWQQEDNVLIVFKYFSNLGEYKRALRFTMLIFTKIALSALLVFSPCIVIWLLSNDALYQLIGTSIPIWSLNLDALNDFALIIAAFVLAFILLKYYLAAFIFTSNDDIDPSEAINMSTIISKRTGGDFFGLVLSFIPWLLLSLFVAPLLYTLPYFLTSYAVHCRFAITTYNLDVERFNSSNAPSYTADEI